MSRSQSGSHLGLYRPNPSAVLKILLRMPLMNGYEATKYIKATTKGQATAIIALTASIFEEERAIVISAGCDDFVRKPFREAEIFETMSKHMGVYYVYAEPTTTPVLDRTSRVTPSDLLLLPPELLAEIENAILCSDLDRLDEAIALMGTHCGDQSLWKCRRSPIILPIMKS